MAVDLVNDVILVRFPGGCGGSFLKNLLLAAKRNDRTDFVFSKHGNSHREIVKELNYHMISESLKEHTLLELEDSSAKTPLFVLTHCTDLNLCTATFNRIITIYYNPKEVDSIVKLVEKKYYNDELTIFDQVKLEDGSMIPIEDWRPGRKRRLHAGILNWAPPEGTIPDSMLFINFREILYGVPHVLFEKLSAFTGIPVSNFSKKNLLAWRELTYHTIW